jgi:hypothetical protein
MGTSLKLLDSVCTTMEEKSDEAFSGWFQVARAWDCRVRALSMQ